MVKSDTSHVCSTKKRQHNGGVFNAGAAMLAQFGAEGGTLLRVVGPIGTRFRGVAEEFSGPLLSTATACPGGASR